MASSCNHLSKLKKCVNSQPSILQLWSLLADLAGSVYPAITTRSNTALGNNYLAGSYYLVPACYQIYYTVYVFEVWLQWDVSIIMTWYDLSVIRYKSPTSSTWHTWNTHVAHMEYTCGTHVKLTRKRNATQGHTMTCRDIQWHVFMICDWL